MCNRDIDSTILWNKDITDLCEEINSKIDSFWNNIGHIICRIYCKLIRMIIIYASYGISYLN